MEYAVYCIPGIQGRHNSINNDYNNDARNYDNNNDNNLLSLLLLCYNA